MAMLKLIKKKQQIGYQHLPELPVEEVLRAVPLYWRRRVCSRVSLPNIFASYLRALDAHPWEAQAEDPRGNIHRVNSTLTKKKK